jgi:hypothetical protein
VTQLDLLTGAPSLPAIDPRDCWRTPPAVVEAALALAHVTRHDTVDVACTSRDCATDRGIYYDHGHDSLGEPWPRRPVWCNPPYSRIGPWAERWHEHATTYRLPGLFLLPLGATTTGYWRRWIDTAPGLAVYVPDRRIEFLPPPGIEPSAPSAGVVLVVSNAPCPGWHRWRLPE